MHSQCTPTEWLVNCKPCSGQCTGTQPHLPSYTSDHVSLHARQPLTQSPNSPLASYQSYSQPYITQFLLLRQAHYAQLRQHLLIVLVW